nr:unnamed protein product [Callosobruchus analis]
MNIEKRAAAIVCYKILLKRKKKEAAKRKSWINLWIRRRVELGAFSTHKGVASRGCTTSSQFRSYECSAGSIYRIVQ